MYTFFGFLLFMLSFSLHEFGHALTMKKYGIQLKEICILGIGKKLFSFKFKRLFGDTPLTVRLIPLFAFVSPTDYSYKRLLALPYLKRNHIYGAGIIMNLLLSAVFLIILMVLNHSYDNYHFTIIFILLLFVFFPKWASLLILPMGFLTIYLIYILYFSSSATVSFNQSVGSVASFADTIKERSVSFQKLIEVGADINLSLALVNSLPFFPTDGGKIFVDTIELPLNNKIPYSRTVLSVISSIPFFYIFVLAIKNDLIRIYHWIF